MDKEQRLRTGYREPTKAEAISAPVMAAPSGPLTAKGGRAPASELLSVMAPMRGAEAEAGETQGRAKFEVSPQSPACPLLCSSSALTLPRMSLLDIAKTNDGAQVLLGCRRR